MLEENTDSFLEMTAGGTDTVWLGGGEGGEGVEEGRVGEEQGVGSEANHRHRHQHLSASLLITLYTRLWTGV